MSPPKAERSRKAVKSPRVKPEKDSKQEMTETKVMLEESGEVKKESDDDLDELKSPLKKKLHLDNITKIDSDTVDEKLLDDSVQPDGEQSDHIPLDLDLHQPENLRYLVKPDHVPHLSHEELKEAKHQQRLLALATLINDKNTDPHTLWQICQIVLDTGNYGDTADSFKFCLFNLDKQTVHKLAVTLELEQVGEV